MDSLNLKYDEKLYQEAFDKINKLEKEKELLNVKHKAALEKLRLIRENKNY